MRILVALAASVLLLACSSDDDARPTPFPATPLATQDPISARLTAVAPTPLPPSPTPRPEVIVRWEPVARSELELYEGGEIDLTTPPIDQPDRPPETVRWSLHAGEVGAPPQTVYETRRRLVWVTWSKDGARLIADFFSSTDAPLLPPYQPNHNGVRGSMWFDTADFRARPGEAKIAGNTPVQLSPAPDGRHIAALMNPLRDVLLYDLQSGSTRKLSGFAYPHFQPYGMSWSPDGRYLLVGDNGKGTANSDPTPYYLVPIEDGPARLVTTSPIPPTVTWSKFDTNKAVYLDGEDLWLITMPSGTRQRLTTGKSYNLGLGTPTWLTATRVEIGNDAIDLASGQVTTYPLLPNVTPWSMSAAISPDGRYRAIALSPVRMPDDSERCETRGNRVYLYDRQSDKTSLIWDCDKPSAPRVTWMADSRNLLMIGANCWACEPSTWTASMKDVVTGKETPLTNGQEFLGVTEVSPDGTKVLVMGSALRIYSQAGDLLQRIEPPAGFAVVGAAWAPDSKRYAYILGPDGSYGI